MQGGIRPNTAKPKDPSELNIEDEELAKDYRKMYERFTEMEAKMASLLQPAFFLQRDLRKKIMGGKFWDQYTKARKMKCPKQDLISLQHSLNNDGEKGLENIILKFLQPSCRNLFSPIMKFPKSQIQ